MFENQQNRPQMNKGDVALGDFIPDALPVTAFRGRKAAHVLHKTMASPWDLDPDAFMSGWEFKQEFADPEYVCQFRTVPPPPPVPVEPPTPTLPSTAQDHLTQSQLDFLSFLDTAALRLKDVLSQGAPDMSRFEVDIPFDTSETASHGTKRAASEPIEAVLFGDSSECSSPKKIKIATHQTTANINTSGVYYTVPAFSDTSATLSRRKQDDAEDKTYIKKPPNAFMLFRAEQRPKVVQELHITDSAKVNVVLGQRWQMLSDQEQAPYYEQAHRERRAHEAKYPGWSPVDNYGKKAKKRQTNGLPVVTNHWKFAVPVASTSQQTVMDSSTTQPMSYINLTHGNQALYTRPVPPSPLAPVEPPNAPLPIGVQDPSAQCLEDFVLGGSWEETAADLTSWVEAQLADSGSLPNDDILSPGSPVVPHEPFDKDVLFDSPEESECSNVKSVSSPDNRKSKHDWSFLCAKLYRQKEENEK